MCNDVYEMYFHTIELRRTDNITKRWVNIFKK